MMNNLFNAIVIVALIGTFLLAPMPRPAPPSVGSEPATAVASPTLDSAAAKGGAELQLIVDGTGRASTD